MNLFDLSGKVSMVTGGSRGLGRGIALALAQAGSKVALISRHEAPLKKVALEIEHFSEALPVVADVKNEDSVRAAVRDIVTRFGKIDILVNAAGINRQVPSLDVSNDIWSEIIDTNLKGTFFCSQAVARVMKQHGGGKIINIGSLASAIGLPMRAPYTASKFGVLGLTKALAVEWAPWNIQVNAIGPGYYKTAMTAKLLQNREWKQRLLERIPVGHIGNPEDLAGAAVFLASRASDYMTGQILYVDGGYLAGWPDRLEIPKEWERET